jgi:hypothetical protein
VIDLPATAAPVDRKHRAKDNEPSLSGSIDKGPQTATGRVSPRGKNGEVQMALSGEKSRTARWSC